MICPVGSQSLKRGTKPRIILTSLTGKLSLIELLLYLLKRRKIMEPQRRRLDPAAVAERRAIHEQILAINRRLENLKGSLSDLTVRLGAHSAAVTLPPTESA